MSLTGRDIIVGLLECFFSLFQRRLHYTGGLFRSLNFLDFEGGFDLGLQLERDIGLCGAMLLDRRGVKLSHAEEPSVECLFRSISVVETAIREATKLDELVVEDARIARIRELLRCADNFCDLLSLLSVN
jgi:hypothetical protein